MEHENLKEIEKLKKILSETETILIGAGAGLSTSAGMLYSGETFEKNFGDFIKKYNFKDLYTASFHNFKDPQEFWAFGVGLFIMSVIPCHQSQFIKNYIQL